MAPGPATAVPRKLLLGLYAVVPAALSAVLLDVFFLDGSILALLPPLPDDLPYWTLVFNLPHVVASSVLLLDREYVGHYRWAIGGSLLAVGALALVHATATEATTTWIAASILSYHLVGQQVGITRLMGGCTGAAVEGWKWMATASLVLSLWPALALRQLPLCAGVGLGLCYFAYRVWQRSEPGLARLYVLGNQLLFLAFIPLSTNGYGFMSALMIRVVHDLTAFSFYLAHDDNRHRGQSRNVLYRALAPTRAPRWLMLVAVSVGVGHLLTRIELTDMLHPVAMVSMFHYCMESVTWRRSGLHRQAVRVA